MKTHRHITVEEILALADRNFEMLPEFIEDSKECNECKNLLEKYSVMKSVLISSRHITRFPDPERINEIAEKSFKLISNEQPIKESIFSRLADMILANLKPLAVTAAAAMVAVVVYNFSTDTANGKTASGGNTAETDIPAEFKFNGVEKGGSNFKTGIASISTISDTHLEAVSANDIKMNSGKALFNVVTGNDFRIRVDEKFVVRVLGTSFTLEYNSRDLTVKVSEGLVEVIRNDDGSVAALSADMEQSFPVLNRIAALKDEKPAMIKPRAVNNIQTSKLVITPDASFLTQGREAVKSGNKGAALQLFALEMEKGREKDKALFEAVKIHENSGSYSDAVTLITSHADIMKSSRIYKEELLIKGCFAQYKMKSGNLSLCKEYVDTFPGGYRKNEIQEIINE